MANLEISNQAAKQLTELSEQTHKTVDEILLLLLDNYGHTLTEAWTDEELTTYFEPKAPLTGKEIVEKHLASGVIGSWADEDITDGALWVEQQRKQHRDKYQW